MDSYITDLHVEWSIRPLESSDIHEIVQIENAVFKDSAWDKLDFVSTLKLKSTSGIVVTNQSIIVGYLIYSTIKPKRNSSYRVYTILNIAVDPVLQRLGAGTALMKHLVDKVHKYKHGSSINIIINEYYLKAQLFLRANGFKAISVMKNFISSDISAYNMVYKQDEKSENEQAVSTK